MHRTVAGLRTHAILAVGLMFASPDSPARGDVWSTAATPVATGTVGDWRPLPPQASPPAFETPAESVADSNALAQPRSTPEPLPQSPAVAREPIASTVAGPKRTELPLLQIDQTAPSVPVGPELPSVHDLLHLLGSTLLVSVIALCGLLAYRRGRWPRRGRPAVKHELQHGGTISLGARIGLHLVTVTDRRFLVAVDTRGVSCISLIPESFPDVNSYADETDAEPTAPPASEPTRSLWSAST